MATLGYTTIGTAGNQQVVTSGLLGAKFTATQSGGITSMTGYVSGTGVANFRFGIYSDNAGLLGNLIATSRQIGGLTLTPQWVTLTIYANIVSGQTYWLTAQGDDNTILAYDVGTTNQGAEINVVLGNAVIQWPTFPYFTTSNAYFDRVYSIYATFDSSYQGPSQLKGVQSIKGLQSIKF